MSPNLKYFTLYLLEGRYEMHWYRLKYFKTLILVVTALMIVSFLINCLRRMFLNIQNYLLLYTYKQIILGLSKYEL